MLVRIDSVELTSRFERSGAAVSPHTGADLAVGSVEFDVRNVADQEHVSRSLSQRREIEVDQGDGKHFVRFKVRSNSYSSLDNRPPWHHTVEVEEAETVSPSEIVLDALTLRPYKYEERVEDGGIVIQARVVVDQATRQEVENRLKADDGAPGRYFDVVRTGVENTPRRMRLGRCFWSEHGDETKYDLTLVEKSADDNRAEPIPDFYPEIPNIRRELALARNLIAELLDSLVESGSLPADRRSAIEDRAKAGMWTRRWALSKLDDIDKHN